VSGGSAHPQPRLKHIYFPVEPLYFHPCCAFLFASLICLGALNRELSALARKTLSLFERRAGTPQRFNSTLQFILLRHGDLRK
jgi:hypothetical protein